MSPIYINNKKIESIYTNNQSIGKVYVGDVLVFQKNNYTVPFIFTIDTTLGTGSSMDLPLRSGYNYDFTVDWGDGSSDVITSYNQTEKLHTYSTDGVYTISITGLCESWAFNNVGDNLKIISIDQWGNTGFINMAGAFFGCVNLTTVNDTDGTWCSNVTSMGNMFAACINLVNITTSSWEVDNVINMYGVFSFCNTLTNIDVSSWNVSNVTSMNSMFEDTPLDTASYDALLIGWSSLPSLQPNVNFNANLAEYSCIAEEAHNILTSTSNSWNITDAGLNVISCNVDPFIFTINTTLGTGNSFNLPLRSGYNYDFVVDWGDGNSSTVTSSSDSNRTHNYTTHGTYQISITGSCEAWYFNNAGDKLKLTSIDQWGNTGFINMMYAFYGCSNLTTVNDTDGTWCSNVTNMYAMFSNCSSLTTLDVSNWDVSNVVYMNGMFNSCSSLTTLDVTNWDVSNVTYMNRMFYYCSYLATLGVSNWNVSKVTDMQEMFSNCSSLTTLNVSNWGVSNVTRMNGMFNSCTSLTTLDVSNWDVSKVTNMSDMFYNTPLDTPSYDALLNGWSGLPSLQSNVQLDANLSQYSCDAEEAHDTLTSSPNTWSITDLGLNVDSCDDPIDLTTHPRWVYSAGNEGLDTFGFNLLPSGMRSGDNGEYRSLGEVSRLQTTTETNSSMGWMKYIHSYGYFSTDGVFKEFGVSVRIVRDYLVSDGTKIDGRILNSVFIDYDNNSYDGVIIGDQVWSTSNLITTSYSNGDPIPTNHTNSAWIGLTTGAYAVYDHTLVSGINSMQEMINAYGILYNYYAVTDIRKLIASAQGRVPSTTDFTQLSDYLINTYPEITSGNVAKHLKSIRMSNP